MSTSSQLVISTSYGILVILSIFQRSYVTAFYTLIKKDAKQIINEISSLPFVVKVESSKEESIDLGSDHIEQQITDLAQKAEDKLQKVQEKNKDQL